MKVCGQDIAELPSPLCDGCDLRGESTERLLGLRSEQQGKWCPHVLTGGRGLPDPASPGRLPMKAALRCGHLYSETCTGKEGGCGGCHFYL